MSQHNNNSNNNNNNQYTLYTPQASFRAFAVLIAAEYNGVAVDIVTGDPATAAAQKLSPVGKLPVLLCPDGTAIFSSHAAARYVGSLRRDTRLLGQQQQQQQQQSVGVGGGPTHQQWAQIDAWMDWCASDLELPASVWFYPVAGYMPFHAARCVCVWLMCYCDSCVLI